MASQTRVDFGGILRPPGQLDATTALQPYRGPLDERSAAHLLRRAGFGGTPDEVRRYAAMSVDAAVESLVRFPSTANLPQPDVYDRRAHLGELRVPVDERRDALKEILRNERESLRGMRLWWLNRMLTTPAPLQEKMTLFWHGHFTSYVNYAVYTYFQNQLFRYYALGNVRTLTHAVSRDPAMLIYLNNDKNVAEHPNENYARELMELFTLGIGHYTEQDVREAARAWTGWRLNKATGVVRFAPRQHDDGSKTFLGQTGNFMGDDVVDIIFAQPQCARFLATSLLNYFVYNDPEPELVDAVADVMRRNNYEIAPVMSAIFRSNVFYSPRAYRALVKSPVEFVVGTYKALGITELPDDAVGFANRMGQILFQPPNVAGWPGGQNWLTSGTMIVRQNFVASVANSQTLASSSWLGQVPMQPDKATHAIVGTLLQGDAAPASRVEVQALLSGAGTSALMMLSGENFQQRVGAATALAMGMPAYQLN
ncbi:MAG: DUF1800 domain-containing protein [Candidatus Eremiobacteraeota bacterium]|nr:DUF1800 domain-containing protein [Candidatus Eremiobacteraeota bacterium]MBV8332277.1 DUF1800 domain-containing protein [Candidatus Eremiobacteraeota bacterium]MBV8722788.1 DUF1800 domain-containing protein [Candidatus Eremiobacteraeota bacterium]